MKKSILVTGGAGYIGSHFVNKVKDLYNVIIVDNFRESRKNIINHPNLTYLEIDIRDKDKLSEAFKKQTIETVVHYAGLADVPDSIKKPWEYYETNTIGGLNLLNCLVENKVKKIVFSSSASVYGEPLSEFVTENHPLKPTNPYGFSKLAFERYLYDYHQAFGINSISFRYFCAAGCDESLTIGENHTPEKHIIPSLIETILGKREKFFIYGTDYPTPDGTGIRDYIHVNDLASAHLLALEKLVQSADLCESFNLGSHNGFSVKEMIKVTEKIAGQKLNYETKARRPGDPSKLVADSTKAQKELNWKAKYTEIEEIILTAYNYQKKYL
jgi:UDP-glucose 4-epimerase